MTDDQTTFCEREISELTNKIEKFTNWARTATSESDRLAWEAIARSYEGQKRTWEQKLHNGVPDAQRKQ